MREEWREVPGYINVYASSFGRIRHNDKVLHESGSKYLFVKIDKKLANIHKLVALAFKGPKPFKDSTVDHIDGNRHNNTCYNLEWVSLKENQSRARKNMDTCGIVVIWNGYIRVFDTMAECARAHGVSRGSVQAALKRGVENPWRKDTYIRRCK